MDRASELAALVSELSRRHPSFKRVTIERLVERTAGRYPDLPTAVLIVVLRGEVDDQLRYVDLLRDPGPGHGAPRRDGADAAAGPDGATGPQIPSQR